MLRRPDQAVVIGLILLAAAAMGIWYVAAGGTAGELVEFDRLEPQSTVFAVDVNTASWPELSQVPEIGETLGRRIVENREAEGPFRCTEDLLRVRGIGEKTLNQMRPYVGSAAWAAAATAVAP